MYTKIKSFEDACKDQGIDPLLPDYSNFKMTEARKQYHLSAFKFDTIAISVNKDEEGNEWDPEPGDDRWTVWVRIVKDSSKRSGFGLSFVVFGFDVSDAFVASRLTFRDEERARYMFDNFPELYEDLLIPQFKKYQTAS